MSSRSSESGQATVEAAFALPVLMILVLLLVQPGIVLYDRIVMEDAASEGCRVLATLPSSDAGLAEDYIRRRLSAVPQVDQFHIHKGGCSWNIEMSGDETAGTVTVSVSNELKPLPLLGWGTQLLGLSNANGNLNVCVEHTEKVQPDWALNSSGGRTPEDWVRSWSE